MKHEITSVSFVSSIADDCETSYYLHWHFLEILRNGSCEFSPVALILQTSADLGVCEDAPGRSNIHYEGNLICKSEWVCGRCFVVSKQTARAVIAKKSLSKTNPTVMCANAEKCTQSSLAVNRCGSPFTTLLPCNIHFIHYIRHRNYLKHLKNAMQAS